MYCKIPGNKEYRINLKCEMIDSYGNNVALKDSKSTIKIELFGKVRKCSLEWLALNAWYGIENIPDLEKHIDKISYSNIGNNISFRIHTAKVMLFKEPIYYKENFRIIPGFCNYAISLAGEILDIRENAIISDITIDASGYANVYIYNSDSHKNKTTKIHRLLCLAWLPNNDYVNRPIINHIDGNKLNNSLRNLEWCSFSENSHHAVYSGLNDCAIKMKTRDYLTGEIVIYDSVSYLAKALNMPNVSKTNLVNKLPGYLYNKRYEIKEFSDQTPWFYANPDLSDNFKGKSTRIITVFDKETAETKIFNNTVDFANTYKLNNKKCLDDMIVQFKENHKYHDVSYEIPIVQGPYTLVNIKNNKIIIVDTIIDVGLTLGKTRTEIQYDLSRRFKYIYNGEWIILINGQTQYDLSEYSEKSKNKFSFSIKNITTNEDKVFTSALELGKYIGSQPRTLLAKAKSGIPYKGYTFRLVN